MPADATKEEGKQKSQLSYNYADDPEIRERAAKIVENAMGLIKRKRSDHEAVWTKCEKLWNRETISDLFDADEVIHVPEAYGRTESVVPRLVKSIYGVKPWFMAYAEAQDKVKGEKLATRLLEHQCTLAHNEYYRHQDEGIRDMGIYGTVTYKLSWALRQRRVYERDSYKRKITSEDGVYIKDEISRTPLKEKTKAFSGPRAVPLNIVDFYILPSGYSTPQEAPYCGDRFQLTSAEIMEGRDAGWYVNTEDFEQDGEDAADLENAEHVFIEMWGKFDYLGEGTPRECVITVGDQYDADSVIQVRDNTFPGGERPYAVGKYIWKKNEYYGVGIINPITGLCQELDDWRTMSFKGFQLMLLPPFIMPDAADIEGEQLLLYPGRIISSSGGQKPEKVDVGISQMSVAGVEGMIRRDIAFASRAPNTWAGQPESARTLGELGMRTDEATISLSGIVEGYRNNTLKPILSAFLALNAMFLDREVVLRIFGEAGLQDEFLRVSPADMQANYRFKILDSSEIAYLSTRGQQFTQLLQALPTQAWNSIPISEFLREMWRSMGWGNADNLVISDIAPVDQPTPEEHLEVIMAGHLPKITPGLPADQHGQYFAAFKGTERYRGLSLQAKEILDEHLLQLGREVQRRQQIATMQAQQAAQQAQMQGGAGGQQPNAGGPVGPTAPGIAPGVPR